MRKLKFHNILIILLALSCAISGCSIAKKNKLRNLIGTWKVIDVVNQYPDRYEQWVFESSGTVYRWEITDSTSLLVDEGIWSLEQKVNTAFLDIVFGTIASQQEGLSVLWEVLRIKKKTMILTHQDGGLYTKEFEKAG